MAPTLFARQYYYRNCTRTEDGFIDEDSCYVPFWNTKTGIIVKWSLFLGFIVFLGLYLMIGYIHAKKRVQKGLAPLAYHRFLVPRAALAQVDPRYRYPQASISPYYPNGQQQAYDMHGMPPPVYDPNAPRPPVYQPPEGATKVDLEQPPQYRFAASSQQQPQLDAPQNFEYAPPSGPPPSAAGAPIQPQGTGNTNPFRS
ncbi:hypothetical protein QBC35DRAFT_496119 [Podospora australis]|uniref:Uncharacterized protein n=1 Tax=Podospora australis TaxID=1536484 RepID=A0AAN7AJ35_9PEZI|nr:hypothetical protein QBC35DRAFT_496119 [Podospora australis]